MELQLNVLSAYTKFYSFHKAFCLLLKLRFRNALMRFMGYAIVKEWIKANRNLHWLLQVSPTRKKTLPKYDY